MDKLKEEFRVHSFFFVAQHFFKCADKLQNDDRAQLFLRNSLLCTMTIDENICFLLDNCWGVMTGSDKIHNCR